MAHFTTKFTNIILTKTKQMILYNNIQSLRLSYNMLNQERLNKYVHLM